MHEQNDIRSSHKVSVSILQHDGSIFHGRAQHAREVFLERDVDQIADCNEGGDSSKQTTSTHVIAMHL
jgi:hypothetical protein